MPLHPTLHRRGIPFPSLALSLALSLTRSLAGHSAHASPPATAPTAVPRGAQGVLAVLDGLRSTVRTSRYSHSTHIDPTHGVYVWDCSAMAAWVLHRAAPGALATVHASRPVAVDFYRTIRAAPTARARGGWQQVPRIVDAQPGDVLAWARPRWFPSHNTGHVAFVAGTPQPVPGGYLVRIADATSVPHASDTRAPGQSGYGAGTLLVTTDPSTGAGTGYGWMGPYTGPWVIPTAVAIGRVSR